MDAWWLDTTEPDMHSNSTSIEQGAHGPDGDGSGGSVLQHLSSHASGGVYEGARAARPDTRVFILTRSGFAGIQRNAAAVWSGDIVSRWHDLYNQISAGMSVGDSGLPNWTFDIGGFANESRYAEARGCRSRGVA